MELIHIVCSIWVSLAVAFAAMVYCLKPRKHKQMSAEEILKELSKPDYWNIG